MHKIAHLAPQGFEAELQTELGEPFTRYDRIYLAQESPRNIAWSLGSWNTAHEIAISSISDGVKQLRQLAPRWVLYPYQCHRRAALIQNQLSQLKWKPASFPLTVSPPTYGVWTLIDRDRILALLDFDRPFPLGESHFIEDKQGPPNRAYLKLWEIFTILGTSPKPGERCVDLGSSPGGWTWVLAQLGASVISVDKVDLDPKLLKNPHITFLRQSAFAARPEEFGSVDWLCCDVIAYPERILNLVKTWIDSGCAQRIICTIKFQGETDHAITAQFRAIPNSRLIHLFHNKHELTWFYEQSN